jgi:hypothetical protein
MTHYAIAWEIFLGAIASSLKPTPMAQPAPTTTTQQAIAQASAISPSMIDFGVAADRHSASLIAIFT